VENFGRRIDCEEEHYWLFPTPQDIASFTAQDLAELQMSVKKCEYLIGVARLIVEGKLSKELLLDARDYKEAEKMLVQIRGIGPWTANYVLMR
jgi:DNA-3-methyladenine glycosylase II